jgi:bis(5'-nucleosyl)-tetraphosphatase (symmetrical)
MTTYAIGDIQGCFSALEKLLVQIKFDAGKDTLWFTGDIVNRGPQSLEALRFVKSLGDKHKVVLGNHDLHLLAIVYGDHEQRAGDTLDAILTAPDSDALLDWLRRCPLLVYDEATGYVMTHAGLAPAWNIKQAQQLAHEVEIVLRGDAPGDFLKNMYGNQPDIWDNRLQGKDRLRCIVNYFTRMRLCHIDGRLDFSYKGTLESKPQDLVPWFDVKNRVNAKDKIIFGHWAALGGKVDVPNVYALDTGCVWGNCLTAMRLGDGKLFTVDC